MTDIARVALITGGGSGIGAASARRLVADGWRVAVSGRRAEPLEAIAVELGALALVGDASTPEDAVRVVEETVAHFGRLDALVANAGIGGTGSVLELEPETFDEVQRINVGGVFLAARAALPHLLEHRGGIVTIASVAGLLASPGGLAYCTSKAAVVMLTKCLALDHGPAGVRANCVCPGWVRTPMADSEIDWLSERLGVDRDAGYAAVTADVPLRREARSEEIASAVAWLLSDEASYVNGATLTIDGGHTNVDVATLAFGRVDA